MEINCNLMFPLGRMALVVLARTLWNQGPIRKLISKFSFFDSEATQRWVEIERKVLENTKLISLPSGLKCKLLGLIKPIGFEILSWMDFHVTCCNKALVLPKGFCWSSYGTIDRKATAKMLLQDETLDVKVRYELACIYCLEDDIPLLWEQLDEFYRVVATLQRGNLILVSYWSLRMRNQHIPWLPSTNDNFVRNIFRTQLERFCMVRNETAIKYILQYLRNEGRNDQLRHALEFIINSLLISKQAADVSKPYVTELMRNLFLIFSQMEQDQQLEIGNRNVRGRWVSCLIVEYFLYWPMQDLFMNAVLTLKDLLKHNDYLRLILNIFNKMQEWDDYNYEELYILFWEQIPREYRKWFILTMLERWVVVNLLSEPFDSFTSNRNLKTILRSLTVADKEELILSQYFLLKFCDELFHYNHHDLVQCFLEESITSPEMLASCKYTIRNTVTEYFSKAKHQLLILLDNVEAKMNVKQR